MSISNPITTAKPIKKMIPTVLARNFNIRVPPDRALER